MCVLHIILRLYKKHYPLARASKSLLHAGWLTKYPPDFFAGISASVELGALSFCALEKFVTKFTATSSKINFTMVPKFVNARSKYWENYSMTNILE